MIQSLINPKTEEWYYFEPSGYEAPLEGRTWVWGVADCWTLVRDYHLRKGRELKNWERPIDSEEHRLNPMFDSRWEETGFRELEPDEELQEGETYHKHDTPKKHQNKKWPFFKDLTARLRREYKNNYSILVAPGPGEFKEANELNAKIIMNGREPINIKMLISLISLSLIHI